jgi:hypothetical protein
LLAPRAPAPAAAGAASAAKPAATVNPVPSPGLRPSTTLSIDKK